MTKLMIELESKGKIAQLDLDEPSVERLVQLARQHAGEEDALVFEKGKDEQLHSVDGRSAISIVVHRCKKISVSVNFEHHTEAEIFPPAATIFRVLRWAIGHKAFNLDETARAKANLMIAGQESPLPREDSLAKYVSGDTCRLTLELTLRDFTNGAE
jgi:hypothetical protein